MKKLFFYLFISIGAYAQNQEGIIYFDSKMNMHKRIQDPQVKAMIPEWRTTKHELYFNLTESSYRNAPADEEENNEINSNSGGAQITMKFNAPQNEFYKNFGTNSYINETEFLGKKYLVVDSLKNIPWKLGTETKKVAGYNCMNATYENTERKQSYTAWFTGDIVCPSGPLLMGNLPGMILELDMNNGEMVTVATKIDFKSVKSELRQPKNGKKVTQKEYTKIMDDWRKENNMQGGGPMIKVIRN
jgi:GLPGLI family protein